MSDTGSDSGRTGRHSPFLLLAAAITLAAAIALAEAVTPSPRPVSAQSTRPTPTHTATPCREPQEAASGACDLELITGGSLGNCGVGVATFAGGTWALGLPEVYTDDNPTITIRKGWVGQRVHVFKTLPSGLPGRPEWTFSHSDAISTDRANKYTYAPSVSFKLKSATPDGETLAPGDDVTLKIWVYAMDYLPFINPTTGQSESRFVHNCGPTTQNLRIFRPKTDAPRNYVVPGYHNPNLQPAPTNTPSPTPTQTPTNTPTNTPSPTPTATSTPTNTPRPGPKQPPTATPTNTPRPRPQQGQQRIAPTQPPTATATNTPSPTPTNTPTATPIPSALSKPVLTAQAAAGNAIVLNWKPVPGAASYELWTWWADDPGWQRVDSGLTGTSYTHSGLVAGRTYYYGLRAVDANGATSPWSDYPGETASASAQPTATPTVTPTPIPAALTAPPLTLAAGSGQIKLTWQKVAGAASYELWTWWADDPGWQLVDSSLTGTSYTHTGLVAGRTYYYGIRAVNADGDTSSWRKPWPSATVPE